LSFSASASAFAYYLIRRLHMQTNFRGRDFIGDLDFSKEEVETVLDVAFDLKRKRAWANPMPAARQGAGHALLLQQHPHPRFLRGWHGPAGRPRRVHREQDDPDRPRRHRQGDRRDLRPLLRRHRHPPVRLGHGNRYINEVAKPAACRCSTCSATSTTPSSAWPT
jgi:hypothetical protein